MGNKRPTDGVITPLIEGRNCVYMSQGVKIKHVAFGSRFNSTATACELEARKPPRCSFYLARYPLRTSKHLKMKG